MIDVYQPPSGLTEAGRLCFNKQPGNVIIQFDW
jgi:hypothetical protein